MPHRDRFRNLVFTVSLCVLAALAMGNASAG